MKEDEGSSPSWVKRLFNFIYAGINSVGRVGEMYCYNIPSFTGAVVISYFMEF